MMPPRRLHRTAGAVLAVFLIVHVANHLAALAGVDAHVRFMDTARRVYRQPVVEAVLLLCVVLQAGSGPRMLWSGRQRRRGLLAWLQAGSGAYVALFLGFHVGAVLAGRVSGLDTNFYFAAAGASGVCVGAACRRKACGGRRARNGYRHHHGGTDRDDAGGRHQPGGDPAGLSENVCRRIVLQVIAMRLVKSLY